MIAANYHEERYIYRHLICVQIMFIPDLLWGVIRPLSYDTVRSVTVQAVHAYPDPVTCGLVIPAITCLPEFSCHVQLVHSEDIQTYLNHPYLASMPVSFINSTHSPLWLCCKSAQILNSEAIPCGYSAQRSAIHTTITIISFQWLFSTIWLIWYYLIALSFIWFDSWLFY